MTELVLAAMSQQPHPWVSDGSCLVCGGVQSDVDPPWGDDEIRALSVYLSDDTSCGSAALASALRQHMVQAAFNEAHAGCAVECGVCSGVVSLLDSTELLIRFTDRTRSGAIRCSCGHPISVVGVRARTFIPPYPRVGGLTWCGSGMGCSTNRCPLKGH